MNASGQMASPVLSAMARWQVAWLKEEPPAFEAGECQSITTVRSPLVRCYGKDNGCYKQG